MKVRFLLLLTVNLILATQANAQILTLKIGSLENPLITAKNISLQLDLARTKLKGQIGQTAVNGKIWQNIRLECPRFQLSNNEIRCQSGLLSAKDKIAVNFHYSQAHKTLIADFRPSQTEFWQLKTSFTQPNWSAELNANQGRLSTIQPFLPASTIMPTTGSVNGRIKVTGGASRLPNVLAELTFSQLGFSDASGLHAGEKIDATLNLTAAQTATQDWQWQADLNWLKGEAFWQPFYFATGGHRLKTEGVFNEKTIQIQHAKLQLAEVGEAEGSGQWARQPARLLDLQLETGQLDLAKFYALFVKPLTEKSLLADVEAKGQTKFSLSYRQQALDKLTVALYDADFEDKQQRFALNHVNASIPWALGEETTAKIDLAGGRLFKIPFGKLALPLQMKGWQVSVPRVSVSMLDGQLNLESFHASKVGEAWQWQWRGGLTPVSMDQLSAALGWPVMHGTLSGVIPEVIFADHTLKVGGALLIKAFDGTMVIKDLVFSDVMGRAPRLEANIDMRQLDLDLLTRAFSFGNMQGRVDVAIQDLELVNWQPVKFNAELKSSPGQYPKKISQKAVQNISALGGAGAAAAIQRSFLSFFEEFGYQKIGLTCKLRNGVCQMGGVETTPQGYIIVKGGGVPAITVIGYNRVVGWTELIDRLKRITQSNVKPIVQ